MAELFDIIPEAERPMIREGFHYLEEDCIEEAIRLFNELISSNFSPYAKSFANYGLGVVYAKKVAKGISPPLEDIDYSINCFEKSLQTLEHADAHLMLGYALISKISHVSETRDLPNLIDKSIASFKKAVQLNKGYVSDAQESIEMLKGLRARLNLN